jgi:hypothetical protein
MEPLQSTLLAYMSQVGKNRAKLAAGARKNMALGMLETVFGSDRISRRLSPVQRPFGCDVTTHVSLRFRNRLHQGDATEGKGTGASVLTLSS